MTCGVLNFLGSCQAAPATEQVGFRLDRLDIDARAIDRLRRAAPPRDATSPPAGRAQVGLLVRFNHRPPRRCVSLHVSLLKVGLRRNCDSSSLASRRALLPRDLGRARQSSPGWAAAPPPGEAAISRSAQAGAPTSSAARCAARVRGMFSRNPVITLRDGSLLPCQRSSKLAVWR
jgi:hypothetical protein